MKILMKAAVARRNQKIHTKSERKIMENMDSPFIMQLHYAFQSIDKLYLVMDFMAGGRGSQGILGINTILMPLYLFFKAFGCSNYWL